MGTEWEKVPLHKGDQVEDKVTWSANLKIVPGCYAYRYLVDGEWKNAEDAEKVKNYDGELVSLLIVEEEEEEEGEGLGGEKDVDAKGEGDFVKEEKTEPEKFDFEQKEKGEKLVEKDQRRAVGVN